MTKYKARVCLRCGKEFNPASNGQKYCIECRVAVRNKYLNQWHEDHKEERAKYMKQWREDNPEYMKQWYKDHLEERKERHRRWREVNPKYRKLYYATQNGKEKILRIIAKRKGLGFVPLNKWFEGSHFHHLIQKGDGLYIPEEMHQSVRHNIWTGKNMKEINTLAVQWWVTEVRRGTH